jgi:hypothetical protein
MSAISLNAAQQQAFATLSDFVSEPTEELMTHKFHAALLSGPAGSGKTSVITNLFNRSPLQIAFCAFTNKATQVLKNISVKFNVVFSARFITIHRLLNLHIGYDRHGHLKFKFTPETVDLLKYDIVIVDECSTISAELLQYIQAADAITQMRGHIVKYIFIGDPWQLPPVSEVESPVFKAAEYWPKAALTHVMRSENDFILSVNNGMIEMPIDQTFCDQFPHNILPPECFLSHDEFLSKLVKYIETDRDTICLTYTIANCVEVNHAVQRARNKIHRRPNQPGFYPYDRCCIDVIYEIREINAVPSVNADTVVYEYGVKNQIVARGSPGDPIELHLYSGIVYEVVDVREVHFKTAINSLLDKKPTFRAQLLSVRVKAERIGRVYQIVHLNESEVTAAFDELKIKLPARRFNQLRADFQAAYPTVTHGYCVTLYKSQGSEWETVFINMLSIVYSCKTATALYKSAYSAISRASKRLYIKY